MTVLNETEPALCLWIRLLKAVSDLDMTQPVAITDVTNHEMNKVLCNTLAKKA